VLVPWCALVGALAMASPAIGGAALPDSVLATVGDREVTATELRRALEEARPSGPREPRTPQDAEGFLELLLDQERLILAALREPWSYTAAESAQVELARDHEALAEALGAALARARAGLGDSAGDAEVGIAAREQAMADLAPAWDDALLARVARAFAALPVPSADSSVDAQLRALATPPAIDADDGPRVRASARGAGDFTVADLLAQWSRLEPVYRPRVTEAHQVRELAENGLFERALRQAVRAGGLDRGPRASAAAARERERQAVARLLDREVHQGLAADSATLARFHRDRAADWDLPARVRLVRLTTPDRHEATRLALRLRKPGEADTLAALGRRSGLRYEIEVSARSDSARYARARGAGVGVVLGPDSTAAGWEVARVQAILLPRSRPFAEVRAAVERRWLEEEAERRLKALVDRERRRTPARRNPGAAARLTSP
jgi:hypothetical protein